MLNIKINLKEVKQMNDNKGQNTTINWYPGHMAKTKRLISEKINLIDVVYEVIDARIPYSSKIVDIDRYIKDKPRILVMTKMDLCDKKETNKWIAYYEKQGYHVVGIDLMKENTNKIIQLTKELMKEKNKKREAKGLQSRRTRVLVVGVPNAGKSTLINRLVGKKAVVTGNKPGVTKSLDWIRINNDIELLDSPGILWPKFENQKVAYNLASFTAIKEEVLPLFDVIEYILKCLEKYYPEKLEDRYSLSKIDDDIVETLDMIGKKRGCLVRGGEIDYEKVYSLILGDIKEGLIKGLTFDRIEDNQL